MVRTPPQHLAGPRHPRRRHAAAACIAAASALAGLLVVAPGWSTAGLIGSAAAEKEDAIIDEADAQEAPPASPSVSGTTFDVPASQAEALTNAWKKVDALAAQVDKRGVVSDFGRRAEAVVTTAVDEAQATGSAAASLEQLLDAPLRALFHKQLHTLLVRCTDRYEEEVLRRPNPLEAARVAEEAFLEGADALVRKGGSWKYEAEHRDLLELIADSYDRDAQLVDEQAKQGRGKQITIEVIKKLQEQQAAVQREVETRGAFPWNIKWQYMVENSPVGFRGQYTQGRSVVELLLMPSPDPRYKKNILNRIGPLNLAVAFDMLL